MLIFSQVLNEYLLLLFLLYSSCLSTEGTLKTLVRGLKLAASRSIFIIVVRVAAKELVLGVP